MTERQMGAALRILYACQKCGEEVGEGEQDHTGRHINCGGTLDPIGECPDDTEDPPEHP